MAAIAVSGCGDDDGGSAEETSTEESESDTDEGGTSTGADPAGLHGLLTLTFYAADAAGNPEAVGLAGAYRATPFEDTDDFYGAFALSQTFPPAPAEMGTTRFDGIPVPFDWGEAADWGVAGNGMRLATDEQQMTACLSFTGSLDQFPLYVAGNGGMFDEGCEAPVDQFLPGEAYTLALFGGSAFDDKVVSGVAHTPSALTVTGPDPSVFGTTVPRDADLQITWDAPEAEAGPEDADARVVIRIWDELGNMITAHAADDGDYTLLAADLAPLELGPNTLSVSREHLSETDIIDNPMRVVTRYEARIYLELF